METIEDILETLLINSNTDFIESNPNVEFKTIYDALQKIKENKDTVINWVEGFVIPFTFTDEDKEELIGEIENI